MKKQITLILCLFGFAISSVIAQSNQLTIQPEDYLGKRGFDVLVFNNNYAEGHQGAIEVLLHDNRIATNGDLRLEPTPGQWSPAPKLKNREVQRGEQVISATLVYPDSSKNRKGFNPIFYPDLYFKYHVHVEPAEDGVIVTVDLEEPLPEAWIGKVGFNLELFPEWLFGKSYMMDGEVGIFPRKPVGSMNKDADGELQPEPMATGQSLVVSPEREHNRLVIENLQGDLTLYDGRFKHNNGWFIVRSLVESGATDGAIKWKISAYPDPDWKREPVIQVSQAGYHPAQQKQAIIEADTLVDLASSVELKKFNRQGQAETVSSGAPQPWGRFLRYDYYTFDFSDITEPGLYYVQSGDYKSHTFRVAGDIYNDQTWQATLEYFLPVQMCHMKVREKYRTWHGRCHLDDALMAPTDSNHFDGYVQGSSTLTDFEPYEPVPGLNAGGWHDAGDYDLRVESQAGTVHKLAMIYDEFGIEYDETTVDQAGKVVEIHQPDGKADILQQIEHGLLTLLGGYDNLGRLYRGIICNDKRQYVLLGDASTMTDNQVYTKGEKGPGMDDRWVFTEENPWRALYVVQGLASASRAIEAYDADLSQRSARAATEIFNEYAPGKGDLNAMAINAAVELYLTTNEEQYLERIVDSKETINKEIGRVGWSVSRVITHIDKRSFKRVYEKALEEYASTVDERLAQNPYGVPYDPGIWGDGWDIQSFGVNQYFLNQRYPGLFPKEQFISALQYVLGVHQGTNTKSYVSGVGNSSVTTAYGINRGDWSFIPGGSVSGTGLIRPNLPELKHWPFFWHQTEYVMGGAATDFMFLSIAADQVLNQ